MKAKKTALLFLSLLLVAPTAGSQSLGDLARQQRDKLSKEGRKATRVFTNENMPVAPRQEGPTAATGISAAPTGESATPPASPETPAQPPAAESKPPEAPSKPAKPPDKAEDKIKTPEYWQARFKPVREQLARAKEQRQLVEDEVQLLEIQQAREVASDVQAEVAQKITAKKQELETQQASTAKAQKALDEVEKDFIDSGAPEEWSKEGSQQ